MAMFLLVFIHFPQQAVTGGWVIFQAMVEVRRPDPKILVGDLIGILMVI
jgi:hypothetical protein